MRAAEEEFEEVQASLDDFIEASGVFARRPAIFAVPGNHDLVRPREQSAVLRSLHRWSEDKDLRAEFWLDVTSPARRLVERALHPFACWWNQLMDRTPLECDVRRGLLPGDFTATLTASDGMRVGIAGLCSVFLQLTGDDYRGRISVDPLQLRVAAGGDIPEWASRHDAVVLITHHGADWFAPESLELLHESIRPEGRVQVHGFAHVHRQTASDGDEEAVHCDSFFGAANRHGMTAVQLNLVRSKGQRERTVLRWRAKSKQPRAVKASWPSSPRLNHQRSPEVLLELTELRDALIKVYSSPADVRRIASALDVRLGKLNAGGAIVDVLHVILRRAKKRHLKEFMEGEELARVTTQEITDAWCKYALSVEGDKTRRPADAQRLADELYERMAALQPAIFEAILGLLAISDEVPDRRAPQPTRAIAVVRLMEQRRNGLVRTSDALLKMLGKPPVSTAPMQASKLGFLALGAALVTGALMLLLELGAGAKPRRTYNRDSVARLVDLVFADERDLGGFVMTYFPTAYRHFNEAMDKLQRIQVLLRVVERSDVVQRIGRAHPTRMRQFQHVLEYEDR